MHPILLALSNYITGKSNKKPVPKWAGLIRPSTMRQVHRPSTSRCKEHQTKATSKGRYLFILGRGYVGDKNIPA